MGRLCRHKATGLLRPAAGRQKTKRHLELEGWAVLLGLFAADFICGYDAGREPLAVDINLFTGGVSIVLTQSM